MIPETWFQIAYALLTLMASGFAGMLLIEAWKAKTGSAFQAAAVFAAAALIGAVVQYIGVVMQSPHTETRRIWWVVINVTQLAAFWRLTQIALLPSKAPGNGPN